MHIESFELRGLRKLNLNHHRNNTKLRSNITQHFKASIINIIVGPNGGGKSTVVDLIRAMGDATVLPTIPRENMSADTSSGFTVNFSDGKHIMAEFNSTNIEEFGLHIVASSGTQQMEFGGVLKMDRSTSFPSKLHDVINFISAKVGYRYLHNENGIPVQKFIDALNAHGKYLSGLAPFPLEESQVVTSLPSGCTRSTHDLEFPINYLKNDIVGVSFNDDELQLNHVPINMFPSGWRAFGGLVAWLTNQSDGSICVIEEPETHVHPKLLRVMMNRISELVTTKKLQIFITTHSSTLIDIYTWPEKNVSLFEANGYQLRSLTEPSLALENLGVRPSDVCQANGVIWVEGGSDRLYLIHWLKLWCQHNGKEMPKENIDFSFVFYGGAMLSHFTIEPSANLIEIFKINLNSIVIMDRDLDFFTLANGQASAKHPTNAKGKIFNNLNLEENNGRYCWITQRYTIESYLPLNFRRKYYKYDAKTRRLKPSTTISKVNVAKKFQSACVDFNKSYVANSDLPTRIDQLYNAIVAWNS